MKCKNNDYIYEKRNTSRVSATAIYIDLYFYLIYTFSSDSVP